MRLAAALLCFLAAPLGAQEREAGPPRAMVSLGFLIASARQAGDQTWHEGFGGEVAVVVPFLARFPLAAGGWAQLQGFDGFSGATRVSGGARLQAWMFGLDAGVAQQGSGDGYDATGYFVLAPGLQLGPGALALRFSWPFSGGSHWPRETALAFTIRLPLFFGGPNRRHGEQEP